MTKRAVFDERTLRYLIIMQDGIKVQVGNFSKINKHAGWNKSAGRKIFKI